MRSPRPPGRVLLPLAIAILFLTPSAALADIVWINEFHYDNIGSDIEEFLEIVVLNGSLAPPDLGTIRVDLYDSNGQTYDHILLDDSSLEVTSTTEADFHVWKPTFISNGTGGIALTIGPNTTNFVSYGGTVSATDGAADGSTSIDTGFTESDSTPVNQSIGLTGAGFSSNDFAWNAPMGNTNGGLNEGQSFGQSVPEPTHGCLLLMAGLAFHRRRKHSTA